MDKKGELTEGENLAAYIIVGLTFLFVTFVFFVQEYRQRCLQEKFVEIHRHHATALLLLRERDLQIVETLIEALQPTDPNLEEKKP